jgi:hypothetical protein
VCKNIIRHCIDITSLFSWREATDVERTEAAGEGIALSLVLFVNR